MKSRAERREGKREGKRNDHKGKVEGGPGEEGSCWSCRLHSWFFARGFRHCVNLLWLP